MRTRSVAASSTRDAIIGATIELAYELERVDFPLEQVAERANRSVQTILRHFGSRDALFAAAIERGAAEVAAERRPTGGGRSQALDLLVEHYELRGRFVLRLLALGDDHGAASVTTPGRDVHRAWVEEVFGLGPENHELADMLVVVTDVYTWKLLRLDRGLSRDEVRQRIGAMVTAVIGAEG